MAQNQIQVLGNPVTLPEKQERNCNTAGPVVSVVPDMVYWDLLEHHQESTEYTTACNRLCQPTPRNRLFFLPHFYNCESIKYSCVALIMLLFAIQALLGKTSKNKINREGNLFFFLYFHNSQKSESRKTQRFS